MVLTRTNPKSLICKAAVAVLQCISMQVVTGGCTFVLISANYAWTGKPFDFNNALLIAVCTSFFAYFIYLSDKYIGFGDMPLFYAKPKKLIEKEKKLAAKWEELEEEASQIKAMHRLETED